MSTDLDHSNDGTLSQDTDTVSFAHIDLIDWLDYNPSASVFSECQTSPIVSSAEFRAWVRVIASTNPTPNSNSNSNTNTNVTQENKDNELSKLDITKISGNQLKSSLNEEATENKPVQDDNKIIENNRDIAHHNDRAIENIDLNEKVHYDTEFKKPELYELIPSSSLRNKNLRILDNLLLLTSEYIDDSPQSIYLIFPYLLRKLVEICDASSSWCWAEIYFRSLIHLIEKSRNHFGTNQYFSKKKKNKRYSPGLSSSSSSFSFYTPSPYYSNLSPNNNFELSPSSKRSKFRGSREGKKGLFHSYRTSFLISLACYLACKMAEFCPDREPTMPKTFTHHIIPTLWDLCCQQRDICDTPGIALMYIFARVDIPIQELVFKYRQATLYSKENAIKINGNTEGDNTADDTFLSFDDEGSPQSDIETVFSSPTLNDYHTPHSRLQLVHPKDIIMQEISQRESFSSKFLKIFWIRCVVMGYYRRVFSRNESTKQEKETNLPSLSPTTDCSPNFNLATKDKQFLSVFKKLVIDSYTCETDENIRQLYTHIFGIQKLNQKESLYLSSPSSTTLHSFSGGAETTLFYAGYSIQIREYTQQAVSSSSIELVRLIQNSLCRLIPRHVHLKLFMISIFNVPSTAPTVSLSHFYNKSPKFSTLGRTIFTLKQIFASSYQRSILDRFIFYMPETIWEGLVHIDKS